MYVADSPDRSAQLHLGAAALVDHLFYQRTLKITSRGQDGLDQDISERVQEYLPQQRSNIWWLTHLGEIERMISVDAHIASVNVSVCRDGWMPQIGCFAIETKVRQADYLLIAADQVRFVARDGVVLESVAVREFERSAKELFLAGSAKPRVLRGIYLDQPSSDIATARFLRVANSVTQLESQLSRRIESIAFINNGEIEVRLEALKFPVRFSIDSLTSLNDQADRFLRLEREVGAKVDMIEYIDMAFDKLGVVRYSQPVISTAAPKAGKSAVPAAKPAKLPRSGKTSH